MTTAYIALGSNLPSHVGDSEATLNAALEALSKLGRVSARSSFYRTAPVGIVDQPEFVNAVAAVEVEHKLTPLRLLEAMLEIEAAFGRNRKKEIPLGPRTLDLDLLFYGDYVVTSAQLTIPHPRIEDRVFVLVPLDEIAPEYKHPILSTPVRLLRESLNLLDHEFSPLKLSL